jgi:iron complex outermembrane recepter protein
MAYIPAYAADPNQDSSADLLSLSLQDLLEVEVISSTKTLKKRTEAASAIHVITAEDIHRSGATVFPELLRLVPGMTVAQLDANKWAISARGFAGLFGTKLLVLLDGRTIYAPLFAGVFWEDYDLPLENIERIEVVRGPGGSLWGANAVNGVINIITKNSRETQGGLLSLESGSETELVGVARYGGAFSDTAHWRLTLKHADREASRFHSGERAADEWRTLRLNFRSDWESGGDDTFMAQGEIFQTRPGQTHDLPSWFPVLRLNKDKEDIHESGYGLFHWIHRISEDSETMLQVYASRFDSDSLVLRYLETTYDVDFQHRFAAGARHELVWGAGFRYVEDDMKSTRWVAIDPDEFRVRTFSAFLRDGIHFRDETVLLDVGTKIEYNDLSGLEVQPSLRLSWTPNPDHTLWGAVSYAVRVPSRMEMFGEIPALNFLLVRGAQQTDDSRFDSEELMSWELGYRIARWDRAAFEINVFHNTYDKLRSPVLRTPRLAVLPFPPHLYVPFELANAASATTYGGEISMELQVADWWFLRCWYALLETDVDLDRELHFFGEALEGGEAEHQAGMHSRMNLGKHVEFDATATYVGEMTSIDIDDYVDVDLRLGWKPRKDLELSLVGLNLFESPRQEFVSRYVNSLATEVGPSFYGKVTWQF